MDVISAHQQGLIEQLEEQVVALAGRPRDHGQRAIVLHHLYNHSSGGHAWALAEARRELRIAEGLAVLRRHVGRWGWLASRREKARIAVAELEEAIGETSRARCVTAYRAYRLSAVPAFRQEAEGSLPSELLALLDLCHASRRSDEEFDQQLSTCLFEESEALATAAADVKRLEAAWAAIDRTGLKKLARRSLSDRALAKIGARDWKRGWDKVERELREDTSLPPSFRANPAQHFYRLQNLLAERRRQQWREECDRESDAFELAA